MSFKEMPLYRYSEPDVTLVVGEKEIMAHEYILASQSEFFKAAFRSGLKESQERRIELPEIEAGAFEEILNWLYRVPLTPPISPNTERYISHLFSDRTTKKIKDIIRGFDFLQIEGGGRDYVKLFEDHLERDTSDGYIGSPENFATTLNEIYKCGCSMNKSSLVKLIGVIYSYSYANDNYNKTALGQFEEALRRLEDPDVRCFRDVSAALSTLLFQHKRK